MTPLFLYYATHIVYTHFQVPECYVDKFSFIDNDYRKYYQAMTNYLDDVVGELVSLLKEKGLWNNLLLVISSDNGGALRDGENNYPHSRVGKAVNGKEEFK